MGRIILRCWRSQGDCLEGRHIKDYRNEGSEGGVIRFHNSKCSRKWIIDWKRGWVVQTLLRMKSLEITVLPYFALFFGTGSCNQ